MITGIISSVSESVLSFTVQEELGPFLSLDNPLFLSVILFAIILIIFYILFVKIIFPLQKKHRDEIVQWELKNARMMALFAELNPNPVFRFRNDGKLILANKSGEELTKILKPSAISIKEILPGLLHTDLNHLVDTGTDITFDETIEGTTYNVLVRGFPELNFAQAFCFDITKRKQMEEELRSSKEKLSRFSSHLQDMQESERKRIARELHDGMGQLLLSIKYATEALLDEKISENKRNALYTQINNSIGEAIRNLKEIVYQLRPKELEELGLVPAVRQLIERLYSDKNVAVHFSNYGDHSRISNETETTLFRIIQEALTNSIKHSQATEVSIELIKDDREIRLIIEDNGNGFDTENDNVRHSSYGMGLFNIAERISALNGIFRVNSAPGDGCEIVVVIPETTK